MGIVFVKIGGLNPTGTSAITYDLNGAGRFGDQLSVYYKAKAVSLKYDLPLLYKNNGYFNQLVMDTKEKHFSFLDKIRYKNIVRFKPGDHPVINNKNNTLYILDCSFDIEECGIDQAFLRDQNFLDNLNSMIKPNKQLTEIFLPSDKITIAVHVRKGGGYDAPLFSSIKEMLISSSEDGKKFSSNDHYADVLFPCKFPTDEFYISQIKVLSTMFHDKPLYVYIFTDDQNPNAMVKKYKNAVAKPNITFACREVGNSFNINVLEDFFSMAKFDCLIRPASSLSYMAEAIGNHKIIIFPEKCTWKDNSMIIEKVTLIDRRSKTTR